MEETKMKVCSKCGKELPANTDYFHQDKYKVDGFTTKCKECRKSKYTNKLFLKEVCEKGFKICIKCKTQHPSNLEFFSKDNSRKDGLRIICKICEKKEHKIYIKNNKQNIKEYNKNYHINNPHNATIRKHTRKAKMRQLEHNFTEKDWLKCQEYFDYTCVYCGNKPDNLTQDHFIPLNNNGTYTTDNIIPCCFSCNSSKQDKDFYEWFISKEFYSKERVNKIIEYFNYIQSLSISIK